MAKTGHKGITTRRLHGRFAGLNVQVKWRGVIKATVVSCDSVADGLPRALEVRQEFETELGKPRTEFKIRHGQGLPFVKGKNVVLYLGKRVRKWSIAEHGKKAAMELARLAREEYIRANGKGGKRGE